MSSPIRAALVAAFLLSAGFPLQAQQPLSTANGGMGIWSEASEQRITRSIQSRTGRNPRRDIVPQAYRTVALNKQALNALLSQVLPEQSGRMEQTGTELSIPLPGGGYGRFLIQESPVMESGLATRFTELKTYVAQGIDDPAATARIDFTPRGFHAIILSPRGDIYVDPFSRETDSDYIAYFKRDFLADKPFSCLTKGDQERITSVLPVPNRPTGSTLRTYRLALACTGEYAVAVCSPNAATVAGTLSAMVTTVNRVSAVYERDFAIRLKLVNNNDKIVYLNGSTDPYTNGSPNSLLSQNQTTLDNVNNIGSANYDIGHVASTAGGGLAQLGVVCRAGSKAGGETGTSAPTGDPYDIDYVAHEMGHQFGGNHTFNSTVSSCSGNRNSGTAYEVGSGITIMAYAGICGNTNLAAHSDDYFHTGSYTEIDNYTSSGSGSGCPVSTATGNSPPAIGNLSSFTVPMQTPFALTASATDADGDTLTYCWEEFDIGSSQTTQNPTDAGNRPLLRSYPPTTNPTRIFPALTYVLNNANVPPATVGGFASGEVLPSTTRTMNFRVTVRDNRAGGGGSNWGSTTVASTTSAGPFVVTAPNSVTTFAGGSTQTVTWNVANTTASPVNCANVKISLSADGGHTFPFVLANSVPNNGSANVTIPNVANVATTQGRIKVEALGNIFFDISDANLTITSTNVAPTLNVTGSISVARGKPAATVANVATASDSDGNPVTVAVSELPFGAHITPSIDAGGTISLSATVDCALVTTLTTRTYPITLTVTDSIGSTTSATVNLIVTPNPSPVLGTYPDINVGRGGSASSTPSVGATDTNGNLQPSPYSVLPTVLPGGGTVSVNQSTGVVTATATAGSTLATTTIRVTALDTCGAGAVKFFNVTVVTATAPNITNGPPPSPVIVGTPYNFAFSASGAPSPIFSLTSGTLPPGINLSPGGVLSGTATSAGTGSFPNITVTASNGTQPDAQETFSLSAITQASNYIAGFGLTGGDAALLNDYDFDGLSNLMEYALGLDPTMPGAATYPIVIIKDYSGTNYLSMTFIRSSVATDLTYIVQASSDLNNWIDLGSSVGGAAMSGPGFVTESGSPPNILVEVHNTAPVAGAPGQQQYMRLKVTTP